MICYIYDIYTNVNPLKQVLDIVDVNNLEVSLSATQDTLSNLTLASANEIPINDKDYISVHDVIYIPDLNVYGVIDSVSYNSKSKKTIEVYFRLGLQLYREDYYTNAQGLQGTNFVSNLYNDWQPVAQSLYPFINLDFNDYLTSGGYLFFSNGVPVAAQNDVMRMLLRQGMKFDYTIKDITISGSQATVLNTRLYIPYEYPIWEARLEDLISYKLEIDTTQPNILTIINENNPNHRITVSQRNDGSILEGIDANTTKPYNARIEHHPHDKTTLDLAIAKLGDVVYQNILEIEVTDKWVYGQPIFEYYNNQLFNMVGDGIVIKLNNGVELISIIDEVTLKSGVVKLKLGQSSNRIFTKNII